MQQTFCQQGEFSGQVGVKRNGRDTLGTKRTQVHTLPKYLSTYAKPGTYVKNLDLKVLTKAQALFKLIERRRPRN